MKHLFGALVALMLCGTSAYAGSCADPSVPKQSAVINIGAAATTVIVPSATSTDIHVCSFFGSLAGTTPSITFKFGTKVSTDCDTGATAISGVILPTSGSFLSAGYGDDIMTTPKGTMLCGTTVGTGSSFQGTLTYVQR